MRRPAPSRRAAVGLAVGAVVLIAGTAVFAVRWSDRGAREASVDDLVERTRDEGGDGSSGFLRPAAGVYTYEAEGTERLSLLDTDQQWGPTVPASVTYDDACWTFRLEYSTNHWRDQRFCPEGDVLTEVGGVTFQRFDFVAFQAEDTITFTCDPPSEAIRTTASPGDVWDHECVGRSAERGTEVRSVGTNTFVGAEDLDIGGETVEALHYLLERALSGDQAGTERVEVWYSATDGLLLRSTRDVAVASPSPVGDVDYTEQGSFELTDLTPQR